MTTLLERGSERDRENILEALEPPNKIDPATKLPYGWDESAELDGLDALVTA